MINNKRVSLYPLKVISSSNGNVRHVIDRKKEGFDFFSDAYISEINPSMIKGWTLHKNKISNLIVIKGHVKFVFLLPENPSKFIVHELSTLEDKKDLYSRICVQPNVWFAFQNLHCKVSRVLNISNVLHGDTLSIKEDIDTFKYNWN